VYILTRFHETKWPRFHVRRRLCREEACFANEGSSRLEKATFRLRSYCKSLIEVLEKYVRLLGTHVNLQFAVQLANLLAFNEEPLGIQHSNLYVRERKTLIKFTWFLNHFSLEQCFGESLSKFCVMSTLRLLNLEIALSAYFGNQRLSTKPRTKRGWEDHCRNIFSRFPKLKSSTVVVTFQFNSVFTCETYDE